jgi:tetratricopeptide (TPR) repeat protein
LGAAYACLNQSDKAVSAFQEATRLAPLDEKAWGDLGAAYVKFTQYDKAIGALQHATNLKPDFAHGWYTLGYVFKLEGEQSEVIKVYEKLKSIDDNLAERFSQVVVQPQQAPPLNSCPSPQ